MKLFISEMIHTGAVALVAFVVLTALALFLKAEVATAEKSDSPAQ